LVPDEQATSVATLTAAIARRDIALRDLIRSTSEETERYDLGRILALGERFSKSF